MIESALHTSDCFLHTPHTAHAHRQEGAETVSGGCFTFMFTFTFTFTFMLMFMFMRRGRIKVRRRVFGAKRRFFL